MYAAKKKILPHTLKLCRLYNVQNPFSFELVFRNESVTEKGF